ncbi:MAG: hypothetical protein CM15mP120_16770 [Pseudomonadota bacterium]|nr:MAG: hypothetical protein CM15mP120_16770 [Pseudomonadota bacterium]
MCGRLHVRAADVTALLVEFLELIHHGPDNLNAAPTEEISVLVSDTQGAISLQPMRWWLTPSWAKQPSTRYSMFNAKAETAANLPSFREPYRKRRCVVPVSGFYEWARRQGHKQAYLLQSAESPGLLLAGLWDRWQGRDENGQSQQLDSFTILTTAASAGCNRCITASRFSWTKIKRWVGWTQILPPQNWNRISRPAGNTYDSIAGIILGEQCA